MEKTFTGGNPFQVFQRGGQVVLSASFPDHGRFIEIQQKIKKKIKTQSLDISAALWGLTDAKKKKPSKNTQWYTKNVYGAQNRLIGRLMYGFTDIERERLTKILNREKIDIKL